MLFCVELEDHAHVIELALSEATRDLCAEVAPSEEQDIADVRLLQELVLCYPVVLGQPEELNLLSTA